MTLSEIRSQFFAYFESKGHDIVPSAPMVVKGDPTLMFINAGMNQFKDYFLGNATPKNPRIANSQKCLRVSGKQNDLEEVGVDTYHHTMFEMLGNWSFGDYFKEETICWSWELLTKIYKLPADRLYVTIFEGDQEDGVPMDQESHDIWLKYIDENRIIPAGKKDNFWEMGDTGPCGPCSEIHIDLRSDEDRKKVDGKTLVNLDHPQVIEIWNNVFMEFNRKADKSLELLPQKHVDTGMGLERLAMALQGKQSNYDTDLFQSLIKHMEKASGVPYGKDESTDIALRVIADHVRAIAFSIADGQLPSNTGAGYVIRRILRRAVRYGYQTLGLKSSFLADLSTTLVEIMGDTFVELKQQQSLIHKVIHEEENSFFRTLEQGLKRIDLVIKKTKLANQSTIEGFIVFELYDTYGFPFDLTSLIARENGLELDEKGFKEELELQKGRARAATSLETDDWIELCDDNLEEFVGYDLLSTHVKIVKYRKVTQKQKSFYQVVFNLTTFYPEGGGQVGDTGHIEYGDDVAYIFDTKKEHGLIIHFMNELPKNLEAKFLAVVNKEKRMASANNHSATHLLHHALRTVLGDHVEQKGSLVNANHLRFDFSHFSKVTDDELDHVQKLVSQLIRTNHSLEEKRNTPMEIAVEMGAMALFGEKYGDTVRVIKFGDSIELCGGTHVKSTGEIGLFKITTETAVAAGIRRIEAITSQKAESYFVEKANKLDTIAGVLKNPKDIEKAVCDLLSRNAILVKEIEVYRKGQAKLMKSELKEQIVAHGDMQFLSAVVDLDGNSIKDILFQLKGEVDNFLGVIGGKDDGKCTLSIIASDTLVKDKGINAGTIIREVSKHIQGGGGGQANFATAGGKNPDGLDAAIEQVKTLLN
ncbi:MAG: alanyl-tRNA synthetase [Crocinitomicaceae bacterium]|jgi:alanyl-tRNA synthetase